MIKAIIDYCARNQAIVFTGTLLACAGAFFAISNINLDAIPDLSDTQVIIFTEWMGRSPDLIEDQITYPIVVSLLATPRVHDVRGFSMFGMSFVYVIFDDGTDLYWARSRIIEYLKQIEGKFPPGVSPRLGPDATSIGWIYQYALIDTTGRHDLADLRTFQDFNLQYALSSVSGVAEVVSIGGYQKQYQVEIDPLKLKAYGVTLADVIRAVRRSNKDVGGRAIEMSGREYIIRGRGYIRDLEAIRNISLGADRSGVPILLGNVAHVGIGPDMRRGVGEFNGIGETVGGIVIMRHGENALKVIRNIKNKIAELSPSFPEGIQLVPVYDRSSLIIRAIETLRRSLIEEGIVVAIVIMIFLLHFRSALVPIITLPVAVALAFIPMYLLKINSNIMSMGGIAIAIGAMVDASIVLVENTHKKLEKAGGKADRREVIAEAIKEVGPSIFYSLLIITVAFLPIFALTGQGGRLFKPLAYTKTFAMFFAALTSITIAPALIAVLIRGKIRPESEHPISRFLIRLYKPFVYVALRNPKSTIAIGLVAILATIPMIPRLGSEFMPPLNEGDLLYMPTTLPNISIEQAKQYLHYQDRIIKSFPEVITVFGKAGRAETATDPAPLSMLETVIQLKPRNQWRKIEMKRWYSTWMPDFLKPPFRMIWPDRRPIKWEELVAELDRALQFPGWTNAWTMPIKTRIDMLSTGIRTPIGIKIFGNDLTEIDRIGLELEHTLSSIPGTRSVFSDRNSGGYYIDIIPDRKAIARYGLTIADVQDVIESAVGGMPIEVTIEGRNRFTINVRYSRDFRNDIKRLKEVLVPLPRGGEAADRLMRGMSRIAPILDPPMLASMEMSGYDPWKEMNKETLGQAKGAFPGSEDRAMRSPSAMNGVSGGKSSMTASQYQDRFEPDLRETPAIPLGRVASIEIKEGAPMIKDEAGKLVGYVFVDIDQSRRDIGGYVSEAKEKALKNVSLPPGYYLKWTGQYELLEQMAKRMKVVVPVTLILVLLLLYLNFRNLTESLIVLVSVPFALVGSIWIMYFLGYNFSTATWVGIIALIGLAAETGIVMVLYLDQAFERRKKAGKMNDLNDIIWAHMEGTVMRIRPKLMTVGTTMIGLLPLLWATGSGADVMKRIAAPMVGGLISSAFLTLEILPVIYTYWRNWQLKHRHNRADAKA